MKITTLIKKILEEDLKSDIISFNVLYHATDKKSGIEIKNNGIDIDKSTGGYFGWGFYTTPDFKLAKSNYADFIDEGIGAVILEFTLNKNANILDLRNSDHFNIWKNYSRKIYDKNLYKTLIRDGIDGLWDNSFEGVVIYNPKVLKLKKIHYKK